MITSTDERQSQKVFTDLGLKMSLLNNPSCRFFRADEVEQLKYAFTSTVCVR